MADKITLLAGTAQPVNTPFSTFSPLAVDFLDALSRAIRAEEKGEEIAAFGFWCRRAHVEGLKKRHSCPFPRLGRGLIFHLAPSNVPTMFAYSMALGMLAGNGNLIRLSQRRGEIEGRLCDLIARVLDRPEFAPLKERTAILSCPRDSETISSLLAQCDGRVIWGGDETVAAVRALPMPAHAVELAFPDRWSMCILCEQALDEMDGEQLAGLARRFYNDTYLMDQNACSSPQMVVWQTGGGGEDTRKRWWEAVAEEARRRYPLGPFQAERKYERFCLAAMETGCVAGLDRYGGNLLYVARLSQLPDDLTTLRGGFGLFFQWESETLEPLLDRLTPKVQTIACAGVDGVSLAQQLAGRQARGVERIVPVGQALEMDTLWDGHDIIAELSRILAVEV